MTAAIVTEPNVNSDHTSDVGWVPGLGIIITNPAQVSDAFQQVTPTGSEGGGGLSLGFGDVRTLENLSHCCGSSHKTSGFTFDTSAYGIATANIVENFLSSVWDHNRNVGILEFFCDYDSRYNASGTVAICDGVASAILLGNYCQTKMDTFVLNAVTGNQSVTGIGFQPDAIIFVGCVDGGQSEGLSMMVGAVDSDLNQWVCANRSRVGTPADWKRRSVLYDDACIAHMGETQFLDPNTVDQLASIVSLDSDGFTINLSAAGLDSNGGSMVCGFVAIKVLSGDGISVGTGSQGDTSVAAGFAPDAILFATGQSPVLGTPYQFAATNGGFYSLGFVGMDATTESQSCYWVGTSGAYTDTSAAIRMMDNTTLVGRATAALTGTGADLTWGTDGGQNYKFGWIAFQIDTDERVLSAETLAPTITGPTAATLRGTITPNTDTGVDVSYYFEWGTTTGYGNTTATVVAGDGVLPIIVTANISGLTHGAIYHYRLVAVNQYGCPIPQNDIEFVQREPRVNVRMWGWRTEVDDDGNEVSTVMVSPQEVA